MKSYPSYSVAIRTLGTAGKKYVAEILSIKSQSVKPEGIYVYIPYGYDVTPVSNEIYIACEKGMVHQRSLQYAEIESDYILFLDDDIFLPENAVETLFDSLMDNNADCIAPVLYDIHNMSMFEKVRSALFSGTYPSLKSSWAFRIRRDSHYSYCLFPSVVMPTQSASFACFLCCKEAYSRIHFEDERWIDSHKFAFGDDQLFFYKMYKYGYKVFVHYKTNIKHLDAKTSRTIDKSNLDYAIRFIRFVIWYRTIFEVEGSGIGRLKSLLALSFDFFRCFLTSLVYMCCGRFYAFSNVFKAMSDGIKYVHSSAYRSIPGFMYHA